MSKKIIAVLLGVVMLFSLGACGARKKLEQKISEKITEGIVDKATGGKTKVDVDKGKLTIKDKDEGDAEFSSGDTKWPKDKAVSHIPIFKKGKIISMMNSDEVALIFMEEVEKKDFTQYVEELKGAGFTNNASDISSGEQMGFCATSNDKTEITVSYSAGDKTLNITVSVQ